MGYLGNSGRFKAAMLEVADYLRKSQSQRIADQRNPDGSPYEPRPPREQLAKRQGAIRGEMFQGLRKARNLHRKATADMASVAINPRVGYVASVHHYRPCDKVDAAFATAPRCDMRGVSCWDTPIRKSRLLRRS